MIPLSQIYVTPAGSLLYSMILVYSFEHPQVDLVSSSTRREDLLLDKEHIQRIWVLRNYLADMNPIEAIEFMKDRLQKTKDNTEFLVTMNG